MEIALPTDLKNLQKLIDNRHPDKVHFFSSPLEAIKSWARSRKLNAGDNIGVISPYPKIFDNAAEELRLRLIEIPRDPEKLVEMDLTRFKAVWLSNPNLCDGFFYPRDLFDSLLEFFLSQRLHIMCEESTRYFFESSENDLVGCADKLANDSRISRLSGTYAYSEEKLSWLIDELTTGQHDIPEYLGEKQHRFFSLPGGRSLSYVYKQLWVQEQKLLRFTDKLRPLLQSRLVELPSWPIKLALYVTIEMSPFLKLKNMTYSQWWDSLQEADKKHLQKISERSKNNYLQISLRANYRESLNLAKRLNEIFLQDK